MQTTIQIIYANKNNNNNRIFMHHLDFKNSWFPFILFYFMESKLEINCCWKANLEIVGQEF